MLIALLHASQTETNSNIDKLLLLCASLCKCSSLRPNVGWVLLGWVLLGWASPCLASPRITTFVAPHALGRVTNQTRSPLTLPGAGQGRAGQRRAGQGGAGQGRAGRGGAGSETGHHKKANGVGAASQLASTRSEIAERVAARYNWALLAENSVHNFVDLTRRQHP